MPTTSCLLYLIPHAYLPQVSKSAQYCFATAANPTGLLLLCEVALGTPLELTGAKSIKKLPAGKDSTKGKGQTEPDPDGDRVISSWIEESSGASACKSATIDGSPRLPVRAPCGGPTSADVRRTSLLVRACLRARLENHDVFCNIPTQVFGRTNILTHLQLCVDWISQYNEFIVYDVAQVKIRYLVKVDFEFTNRLRRR